MNIARLLAEFIGTFTLIFIGAGSICLNEMTHGGVGLLGIAVAHGLALAVMVSALAHISGGKFNPAVSLAVWAGGQQNTILTFTEIVAQLLGAIVGAFALKGIFPAATLSLAKLGTPMIESSLSSSVGIFIEAILTFLLVLVVYGTVVDTRGDSKGIGGFAIGGFILCGILMGGGITGAAMNPARAFGPALVAGEWAYQYVYWIGPIIGGLLAGILYSRLLMKHKL
ncbi:Aquaporin AQPAe.a [Neochlamydia sp. TUME1]|uniref:MIP/aquaporin family protein n=1 Tax=Neochlamydia sp. TUME1 TaxID=1478174 RepID=UPI00057DE9DA|nr:aquaporin [Neochlamydia sp. TUME1]KIC74756.1 Aquaporin AQPAe.a [Neochlamydia sp. TUME1]